MEKDVKKHAVACINVKDILEYRQMAGTRDGKKFSKSLNSAKKYSLKNRHGINILLIGKERTHHRVLCFFAAAKSLLMLYIRIQMEILFLQVADHGGVGGKAFLHLPLLDHMDTRIYICVPDSLIDEGPVPAFIDMLDD